MERQPGWPLRFELRARQTNELVWRRDAEAMSGGSMSGAAFSPGGSRFAYGVPGLTVVVVDLESGRVVARHRTRENARILFENEDSLLVGPEDPRCDLLDHDQNLPARRIAIRPKRPAAELAVEQVQELLKQLEASEGRRRAELAFNKRVVEEGEPVLPFERADLYLSGAGAARSADGRRFFYPLPTQQETGLLRIGEIAVATPAEAAASRRPQTILQAQIPPGCVYGASELLFSPEQEILAATYFCTRPKEKRYGLAIWNLRDGEILAQITNPYGAWTRLTPLRGENAILAQRRTASERGSEVHVVSWDP